MEPWLECLPFPWSYIILSKTILQFFTHVMCVDYMDHGNAFSFQLSFCFSRYMMFVLELDSWFKSLSQSFLWRGNFTSRKPPFCNYVFTYILTIKHTWKWKK
jgi:hypothetical protein